MSPERSSSNDEENLSSSPGVLLDEKLPGPLYGLPALPVHSCTRPVADEDLESQREKFELELLSRSAIWNADLPIHRLPAEILLHVFEHLRMPAFSAETLLHQASPLKRAPNRSWISLTGVCRYWCALIRNAGRFWSDIVVLPTTPQAWIDLALRRAGRAPLRVEIASDCDVPLILAKLTEHIDHIEWFKFSGNLLDLLALQVFLVSRSFSILNNLTISLPRSVSPTDVHILTSHCAHLGALSLTRTSLPWTESVLKNLKFLSLTNCQLSTPHMSFTDFFDILEQGQQLRYLRLQHFLSTALCSQPSMPHERVGTLPHLRHLICHDVLAHVGCLVTHLRIPQIEELDVVGEYKGYDDPTATYSSLLPRIPGLAPTVSVSLSIGDMENRIRSSFPITLSLSLRGRTTGWGSVISRSLRELTTLCGPALTQLTIVGGLGGVPAAIWDLVFDSFPALEDIMTYTFEGRDGSVAAIRSLAAPGAHASGIASVADVRGAHAVRCRNLRRLEVESVGWGRTAWEDVLQCLRFRATSGARKLDHVRIDIRVTMRTDRLNLDEEYRERFEELAETVDLEVLPVW